MRYLLVVLVFFSFLNVYADGIIVTMAGDCTLGSDPNLDQFNRIPQELQKNNNDYSYIFKKVKAVFDKSDITVVNLETTFTDHDQMQVKQYTFKGPGDYAKILVEGGITAVNLSNNHIYDFNVKGFEDTVENLKKYNMNYFGEGIAYVHNTKGKKVGFLGYMGWRDSKVLRNRIKKEIAKLKADGVDYIFVSFHWGEEREYEANKSQIKLAKYTIDTGADVVWGHHPHVVQGIEKYNGKFIFYSLGNFSFGGNRNPDDKDSIIAQIRLNNDGTQSVRVIPAKISSVDHRNNYQPVVAVGKDADRIIEKVKKLSTYDGSFNNFEIEAVLVENTD